jgi:hypothetical protein
MVDKSTKLSQNSAFLSTAMDGEIVMMSAEDGTYFSLSAGVGTRVWELLESPKTLEELSNMVVAEFDVKLAECEADVLEYVNALVKQNILIAEA